MRLVPKKRVIRSGILLGVGHRLDYQLSDNQHKIGKRDHTSHVSLNN